MKPSFIRIDNPKDFKKELNLIEQFNSFNNLGVNLVDYKNIQVCLTKISKGLNLEVGGQLTDGNSEIETLLVTINKENYKITLGSYSSTIGAKTGEDIEFVSVHEIKTLISDEFISNGRFKAFYPLKKSDMNSFRDHFETVTYQIGEVNYAYDCLRISIKGKDYDIIQLKTDTSGFYTIECLEEEMFEDYLDVCFSIRQATGFINRLMVGYEEYVFDNSGKLYYSNNIRPTIKGMYFPIITNPYSRPDIERSIAKAFLDKLTRISLENLSNLATEIHSNGYFSTAILTILEVTSLRSLLVIPSSLAVVIELLSKVFKVEEVGLEYPIPDSSLKKKIVQKLIYVIDKNSNSLSEKSVLKLKRRLQDINKPINKQHLTNNENLIRPFEQLGVKLTLHDLQIIEHRNDLLHGNVLLDKDANQSDDEINTYMAYVSAKLYTLISKLILKSIGYNGYVFNNSKYLEKHLNICTEEEFFENI